MPRHVDGNSSVLCYLGAEKKLLVVQASRLRCAAETAAPQTPKLFLRGPLSLFCVARCPENASALYRPQVGLSASLVPAQADAEWYEIKRMGGGAATVTRSVSEG